MKKLIIFVVVAILALSLVYMSVGCKEETAATTAAATEAETTAAETTADVTEEEAVLEDTLNVISWGHYIDYAIEPFEQKYGVKVNLEYFDDIADQINKLIAVGEGTYDVTFAAVENYQKYIDANLVEPLEISKLENWNSVYPSLQNLVVDFSEPLVPEGFVMEIPFSWGTTGIVYNPEKITEEINSWGALWDEKYSGRLAILNSVEENQRSTAIYLGLDLNDFSDDTLNKIVAAWREQKPLIKTYWDTGEDIMQLMTSGEIWITNMWDGTAREMILAGDPVTYLIPDEGACAWQDGAALVKGAPHPNLALKFIDFLTSPETQLQMSQEVNFSPANSKVRDMVDEDFAKFIAIDNPGAIDNLKFQNPIDFEVGQRLTELWNEVQS